MKGKNSNNYKRRIFENFEIAMAEDFRKLYTQELTEKEREYTVRSMEARTRVMEKLFPSSKDRAKITKIIKSFE